MALLWPDVVSAAGAPIVKLKKVPAATVQPAPRGLTPTPQAHGPEALPLLTPNPRAFEKAKRAADRRAAPGSAFGPSPSAPAGPSPLTPAVATLNQPGSAATDNTGQFAPPDTTGSIGPNNYVEMVNKRVAVYDRTNLSQLDADSLDTFAAASGPCDPQIAWDNQAARWFYVVLAPCSLNQPQYLLAVGWSKTSSPTPLPTSSSRGNWCSFLLSTGTELEDYPKLGHNDKHFIIGVNGFTNGTTFAGSKLVAIEKPSVGDTSCTAPPIFSTGALANSDSTPAWTPEPANTADGGTNGYVIATHTPPTTTNSNLMAWHLSGGGGGGAPTLTADGLINVSSYGIPPSVPQPGTANVLDSLDTRLTQAVAETDPSVGVKAVWTQHTINSASGRSVVRWYELLPGLCSGGTCPAGAKRQEGTISSSSDFGFNGAISPTGSGQDAVIHYNLGSGSRLAEIHTQSRQSGLTLGTTEGDVTLGTSSAADQDGSCAGGPPPTCRWGDYAGATPDPTNTDTVWGSNQALGTANGSNAAWTTRNFALKIFASYPRPKGATPTRVSLTPAYKACTAANRTHNAPLSIPSCNPPQPTSRFLTVGTPDANGLTANSIGSVLFRVTGVGTSSENIAINVSMTDVRCQGTTGGCAAGALPPYTGVLHFKTTFRVTDKANGGADGTTSDYPLQFSVLCAPAGAGVGSTCSTNTTINAVVGASAIVQGQRAIWQLPGPVDLYDGGSTGAFNASDATLFAEGGLFAP
jgi:hypothetical protein